MAERLAKPKRPILRALPWSDDDLDDLSTVRETDKLGARALWDAHCPPWARGLLDAAPAAEDGA